MTSEARRFYLLSQVFFSGVSMIPWSGFAILAAFGFGQSPLYSLFVFGYGLGALYLLIRWLRSLKRSYSSIVENLAAVALWAIPFTISLTGIVLLCIAQFDSWPDVFLSEYRPLDYIAFPLLSAVWFGVPLLYAAFLARGDWVREKGEFQEDFSRLPSS